MDNLQQVYKQFLQEKVIKDFLFEGKVPTKPEVDTQIEVYEDENPGLLLPFFQPALYEVQESEKSSVSKMNQTFSTLHDDLSVLYLALRDQAKIITETYDSMSSELSMIKKKLGEIEAKASNLLFLAPDSEGLLDFVSDSFADKQKINSNFTTAFIDTVTNRVTLAPNKLSRIEMTLLESDVQFNVITRENLLTQSPAAGSSILNAFTDENSIWLQQVRMSRGSGSVAVELMVRMPSVDVAVNKITITTAASDEGNISTVTAQASNDGLNWFSVVGEGTTRLIGDAGLIFAPVTANYWKLIFNKAGYDEYTQDSYLYEFGAKAIRFYGVEYGSKQNETESILISEALSPSSGVEFNKASLSCCFVTPADSYVRFFLAGLTGSQLIAYNNGTITPDNLAFIEVDPEERKQKSYPAVVDFSAVSLPIGYSSTYGINNSISFKDKARESVALNFTMLPAYVKEELKILRNVGDNQVATQISGLDRGWNLNGSIYSTLVYVDNKAGLEINLGATLAELNGSKITGRIIIPQGVSLFSTSKENWRKVDPLLVGGSVNADPLYPYNHKYLIEGLKNTLYNNSLSVLVSGKTKKEILDPDEVYLGVKTYWATTMESVSMFDFTSNVSPGNYKVFSFTKDVSGNERIVVKYSDEPGLMTDENFAIITRSVTGDLQKAVMLKAILSSKDSRLTPILDEYIIKLGY